MIKMRKLTILLLVLAVSCAKRKIEIYPAGNNVSVSSTPLHRAAQNGNIEEVRRLLENGADVNAQANNGSTPLHAAAEKGQREVVQLLLDRGADIEVRDMFGDRPLHTAAEEGQREVVECLVKNGADVNAQADNGSTPLHKAACYGHLVVVKHLINAGTDILPDAFGRTPLYLATEGNYPEVVELLLRSGAYINVRNSDNETPLHIAIRMCNYSVIEVLLNFIDQAEQRLREMIIGQKNQEGPSLLAKRMENGEKDNDEEDKSNEWEIPPLLVEKIAQKVVDEALLIWLPLFSIKSKIDGKTVIDLLESTSRMEIKNWGVIYNDPTKKRELLEKLRAKWVASSQNSRWAANSTGITSLHWAAQSGWP